MIFGEKAESDVGLAAGDDLLDDLLGSAHVSGRVGLRRLRKLRAAVAEMIQLRLPRRGRLQIDRCGDRVGHGWDRGRAIGVGVGSGAGTRVLGIGIPAIGVGVGRGAGTRVLGIGIPASGIVALGVGVGRTLAKRAQRRGSGVGHLCW